MPSVRSSNSVKFTSLRLFRCRLHANPIICRPAAVAQGGQPGQRVDWDADLRKLQPGRGTRIHKVAKVTTPPRTCET